MTKSITIREIQRSHSNNDRNPNKNICALHVAKKFCVENSVRYLHTIDDLLRAVRTKYVVRSRKCWYVDKGEVIDMNTLRERIEKKLEAGTGGKCAFYIVHVEGHVLLLNRCGKIVVDTAMKPYKEDYRKVYGVYGVIGVKE